MLSVILPTKNEPLINELIREVHRVLRTEHHEIIVIDQSDSPAHVRDARLYQQQSSGLGNAVLEGVRQARAEEMVVMDADFSHDPEDIPRLLRKLREGYDVVIGSRYCPGGSTEDTGRRYGLIPNAAISKLYCWPASALLGLGLTDPMSGFAAARREVYDALVLHPLGYKIHMETAFKARQKGFRIAEVPITFHRRKAGQSKTGVGEAIRTLWFMVLLRLGLRS